MQEAAAGEVAHGPLDRVALGEIARSPAISPTSSASVIGVGWMARTCCSTAASKTLSSSRVVRMCSPLSTIAPIRRAAQPFSSPRERPPPRLLAGFQRRKRPARFDHRAVEVLGRAADLLGAHQLDRLAFGQHPDVVAERAERLVQA